MRSTDTLTRSELPPWARTALAVLFAVAIGVGVALFQERALPLMAVEAAVILGFVVRPALLLDATAALVPLGVFVAYLTPFMPGQAQAVDALLFSFAVSSFAHPSAHGGRRRLPVAPMVLGLVVPGHRASEPDPKRVQGRRRAQDRPHGRDGAGAPRRFEVGHPPDRAASRPDPGGHDGPLGRAGGRRDRGASRAGRLELRRATTVGRPGRPEPLRRAHRDGVRAGPGRKTTKDRLFAGSRRCSSCWARRSSLSPGEASSPSLWEWPP